jgi:UrcA family protein
MFTINNDTSFRFFAGAVGTLIAAGACLFGAAGPAYAGTADAAPRTQNVVYGDLNLGKTAGRVQLDSRIKAAARQVCVSGGDDIRSRSDEARCIRAAIAGARSQLNVAAADRS